MAPVAKRAMIDAAGSTSSSGTGVAASRSESSPRRVASCRDCVVDERRVLLEDLVALGPSGVLQLEDGLRVEEVVLPLATPLVLPADAQLTVGPLGGSPGVRLAVACGHLGGEHVEAHAAEGRRHAGEVAVDDRLGEPERLEDLRAGVRRDRRDPHLRHDLEDALGRRLDVVARASGGVTPSRVPEAIMSSIDSNAT